MNNPAPPSKTNTAESGETACHVQLRSGANISVVAAQTEASESWAKSKIPDGDTSGNVRDLRETSGGEVEASCLSRRATII